MARRMRRPSARCGRNQAVTLYRYTWSTDADGGSIRTATDRELASCSVEPAEPELEVDETGRWTTHAAWTFRFNDDPRLKPLDAIQWTDPFSGVTHTVVVAGGRPVRGLGATYEVRGVERS